VISPAREIAFKVLESVHGGAYASDSLRHYSQKLSARDAALTEAIVFGCLRYQAQLDFLITHYSGRTQKLDTAVRIALRMGIFQIRYLNKIPAHAAVQESVELVKRAHKRSASGFVNAVLRKVNRGAVRWPDRATELSMPPWLLARWDKQYGAETAAGIARAALEEPAHDTNAETGRQQDIGAQSIVPYVGIKPGMMALDLCAAPGNKTAQMLAAGAKVIACDRSFQRLSTVPEGAMRVVADATRELPFRTKFDRILVDAPCSGTGTLARNPEIKWRVNDDDIKRFPQTQRTILKNALRVLKSGGRLVYSTCSLEQEENEGVLQGLDFREHTMRIPGREVGDGFFIGIREGPPEA
jgi:16S rRNA (cytosine967-C5)-methyltransferase